MCYFGHTCVHGVAGEHAAYYVKPWQAWVNSLLSNQEALPVPKQPVPFTAADFDDSVEHIVLGEDDAVMTETGVHRLLDTTQDAILVAEDCDPEIEQLCATLVGDGQIEQLTVSQIADRVSLGGSAVLVTPASSLGPSPARLLNRWRQADPTTVIVVSGTKEQRDALLAELSGGLVHRFLITPTSGGQTRLVLASALKRHGELRRAEHTGVLPALPELVDEPGFSLKPVAIGAVVAIIVVVAAWLSLGRAPSLEEAADNSPAVSPPAVTEPESVAAVISEPADKPGLEIAVEDAAPAPPWADNLARAEQALADGAILGNEGAVALFKGVLDVVPGDLQAQQGLDAAEQQLLDRVTLALAEGRVADAEFAVADLAYAFPNQARLSSLETEVRNERIAAQPVVTPPRQPVADFVPLRAIVNARIEAGQLLAPDGDSAQYHLEALRRQGDQEGEIAALETRLRAAAMNQVSEALAVADWTLAEQRLVVAGVVGVTPGQLADLRAALAGGQAQQRLGQQQAILDRAIGAIEGNRLLAPPGDNAVELLISLQEQNADLAALEPTSRAAAEHLGVQAESAIAQGDLVAADQALTAVTNLYPQLAGLDALTGQLSYATRQAELFAELVSASELVLLSYEPPRYPTLAQRRNLEGWVEMVFTVTPEGVPTNIIVRAAEPADIFDKNALEAISTARFEPYLEDGSAYARRAWIRIRFNLD